MSFSEYDKRMKRYEATTDLRLLQRTPVIIRIDGHSFHTFTQKFDKPFDTLLVRTMQKTMQYLCENIQGCIMGYTQSDEISLLLIDYQNLHSCAWFDNRLEKLCSVAASMATMAFNKAFFDYFMFGDTGTMRCESNYVRCLLGAMFDARAFNIPREEVCNYFYWRQQDAVRNSIQATGQAYFTHKELDKKKQGDVLEMLKDRNMDWNELPIHLQRGSTCVKRGGDLTKKSNWEIDTEIPLFKGEGRSYVTSLIQSEEGNG